MGERKQALVDYLKLDAVETLDDHTFQSDTTKYEVLTEYELREIVYDIVRSDSRFYSPEAVTNYTDVISNEFADLLTEDSVSNDLWQSLLDDHASEADLFDYYTWDDFMFDEVVGRYGTFHGRHDGFYILTPHD